MRRLILTLLCLAATARADEPAAPISPAKLNHYVEGYNFLVGTFGLEAEYRLYAAQHVSAKTGNDGVQISDGWLEQGDDELKQGRNVQDGPATEVDAAADTMITVLDRLIERLHGLSAYYATRGQLEDGFARGKREDPLVLADFKTALAALGPLSDALDVAIDRRDTAELYVLQKEGDTIGFHGGMAMHEAKQLMHVLDRPGALADKAVTARADTLADAIVQSVADETVALDKAKAAGDDGNGLRNSNFRTAAGSLQNLVGIYREMRHTGNAALMPVMLGAYNSAVDAVNTGL